MGTVIHAEHRFNDSMERVNRERIFREGEQFCRTLRASQARGLTLNEFIDELATMFLTEEAEDGET